MNLQESYEFLKGLGYSITEEQILENNKKTVIVGMSGGVDSSVCAILVKLMGYNTIGMFMRNWEEIDTDGVCTAEVDYQDVIKVCEEIDIPYYSVNFSEEYRNNVFADFVKEYKAGHTPNPDILCNREIKFKVFFEKAKEFGADYLATGHYCQKVSENSSFLKKGFDTNKDQTYFLYTIKEDVLRDVIFPIGHLPKSKVREVAEKFDLVTYDKKDSTGICFIGERNFKQFLSNYIKGQKGQFINLDNNQVLGDHDGMCFYTIGQRKGLGLGGPGGPWFVAKKDIENNIVYVVEGENNPALFADELIADEISWINKQELSFPLKCHAKIRYRQGDQACIVDFIDGELKVTFDKPQRAISVRQSIVFYQEDICLGGAIIKTPGKTYKELNKNLPVSRVV